MLQTAPITLAIDPQHRLIGKQNRGTTNLNRVSAGNRGYIS